MYVNTGVLGVNPEPHTWSILHPSHWPSPKEEREGTEKAHGEHMQEFEALSIHGEASSTQDGMHTGKTWGHI